jgi:outer membrane receptor protein involved in Fe transport
VTFEKRIRLFLTGLIASALFFLATPADSRPRIGQNASGPKDTSRDAEKKKAGQEKKEQTKLFQLNPVTIDVVESLRDKSVPNMTVVKPELFPMTIGITLDTALERQPGVDVQRIQEVGTAADDDSIKIRGMGARRIKVLRNGRPLNSSGVAGGYFIDFTMIPLANADRVEVIKGVGDPRYGNILGGVINLVPKRLTGRPSTEVQASYSSYATAAFDLYHGFKPGAFEYSLAAGYSRSDGYLRNGGIHSANADVHLGYDFPFKGRATADFGIIDFHKGFAVANRISKAFDNPSYETGLDAEFPASDGEIMYGAMGGAAEPGSWWDKKKWTIDVNYEQAFGDWGYAEARYWRNHGNREAYNKKASNGRVFHKMFYDDRSRGFSFAYHHYLSDQAITAGLDYSHLNDDGDENLADDYRAPFRNGSYVSTKNLEFYVMDEVRLFGARLSLVPGVRFLSYDGIAGPAGLLEGIPGLKRTGWAPSLKISFFYSPDSTLYLSAARALRMPTAPEHFWHYDYSSGVDTSDLPFREEDGLILQAGWRTTLPTGTNLEVAPYYYRIAHFIQFDLINFVSYNIDRADLYGLELEVSQDFGRGWTAFANYSFQKSATEGDPFVGTFVNPADRGFAEIPNLPAHKVNLGIQFKAGNGARLALFAQAVSSQNVVYNDNTLYNSDLRVRTQAGYVRVDLEARYPLGRFKAGLFVRNILNASYQERFGFPAAGRNFGLSVKAGF